MSLDKEDRVYEMDYSDWDDFSEEEWEVRRRKKRQRRRLLERLKFIEDLRQIHEDYLRVRREILEKHKKKKKKKHSSVSQNQQTLDWWRKRWTTYQCAWDKPVTISTIPWPVWSGKMVALNKAAAEKTYNSCVPQKTELIFVLKKERIRWHLDKIRQKYGKGGVLEEDALAKVT